MSDQPASLPFSEKYDAAHSNAYFEKHRSGFQRQFSDRLEQRMAAKALGSVGEFSSVLDLPCGAGRFWDLIHSFNPQQLIAADYSQDMLDVAASTQSQARLARTAFLRTSAFAIDLPDASVDLIFCMRLIHHVGEPAQRQQILQEFARVTRRYSIVSLWVDGNLQARRRRKLERSRKPRAYQNRFVLNQGEFEKELVAAGHEITAIVDMVPGVSMWRTYVLRSL